LTLERRLIVDVNRADIACNQVEETARGVLSPAGRRKPPPRSPQGHFLVGI